MAEQKLTQEDLEQISALQAKKDLETGYHERPLSQRVFAWVLAGIVMLGVILTCYWLAVPPV